MELVRELELEQAGVGGALRVCRYAVRMAAGRGPLSIHGDRVVARNHAIGLNSDYLEIEPDTAARPHPGDRHPLWATRVRGSSQNLVAREKVLDGKPTAREHPNVSGG